jgi:cyclopropane-fatty-acyl-phospholipid synthase
MLNHTITRPNDIEPTHYRKSFINRYVFPDGKLPGPATIVSAMNDAGFEIRHEENLREHYALTLKHWCENLEEHWDEAVAEAGEGTARVWRLYMAASRVGFDLNTIQLHQTLGVKPRCRRGQRNAATSRLQHRRGRCSASRRPDPGTQGGRHPA